MDRVARIDGEESLYTFLHLTFQEYLAAYHISQLREDSQIDLIKKYGKKQQMQVVWKFYCGLVDFKDNVSKFAELMKCFYDDQHKVQCAFESQQSTTCNCLVESNDGRLSFDGMYLNPTDFTAIGYIISNATNCPVEELGFKRCNFREEGVEVLLKETGQIKIKSIKHVHFSSNCSQEQFRVLIYLLQYLTSLQTLDLASTRIGIEKMRVLASSLEHFSNLKKLKLYGNGISSQGAKALTKGLEHCSDLHTLDLRENKLGDDSAKALAEGLEHCSDLHTLDLRGTNLAMRVQRLSLKV